MENGSTGTPQKKRSVEVVIASIILFLFGLGKMLFAILGIQTAFCAGGESSPEGLALVVISILALILPTLWIVFAIGLFMLKKWARIATLVLFLITSPLAILFFLYPNKVFAILLIGLYVGFIYYLTRPKVKRLFIK